MYIQNISQYNHFHSCSRRLIHGYGSSWVEFHQIANTVCTPSKLVPWKWCNSSFTCYHDPWVRVDTALRSTVLKSGLSRTLLLPIHPEAGSVMNDIVLIHCYRMPYNIMPHLVSLHAKTQCIAIWWEASRSGGKILKPGSSWKKAHFQILFNFRLCSYCLQKSLKVK